MSGESGEIRVNSSESVEYDRERDPTVSLTVIAKDEEGKEARTNVTIRVLDKNDNDPKFLEDYEFDIYQVSL
jgi:hypothetical protein